MYSENTINKLNLAYVCVECKECVISLCVVFMCGHQTENTYFLSNVFGIFTKIGYILDHKDSLSKSWKKVYRLLTIVPVRKGNIEKGLSGYICIVPGEGI